ncbi:MAG: aspartate aminotransferase family protein [Candidatus Aenigmarchaeota archaeon]|nr:aspartate aminotransferase family protein [Candidatus Aenigmarchaeota archaeon]
MFWKIFSGRKTKNIVKRTKKSCIETTFAYPLAIKTGSGCFLEDVDGKVYLDFNSNVCSCNIGYGHPEIIGVLRSFSEVGAHKIAGQDFYTEEQIKLAEKVLKITPRNLSRVLFTNSGAEAVENAIKFAYRKKGPLAGVSFFRAFHGRTIGALSFTDSKAVQKKYYPEVNNELIKYCTDDNDPDINQLEELIKREAEPAFVIVECIQGEGGYRPASKKFIKTLREVTKKHDVPLIFDEIQAGMGRTGKWWSFQHYDVEPDIMTVGKSLQVGAVVSSKKYDPNEPGAVSSTWGGGHRIDLAVGLKTIEIMEKEKLIDNANIMGDYFMKRFKEMQERYPEKIVDVRGLGLMIGVEFNDEKQRDIVVQKAFKNKLLLLGCGFKTLRIAPPLIIKEDDANQGISIIEKIVRELR